MNQFSQKAGGYTSSVELCERERFCSIFSQKKEGRLGGMEVVYNPCQDAVHITGLIRLLFMYIHVMHGIRILPICLKHFVVEVCKLDMTLNTSRFVQTL